MHDRLRGPPERLVGSRDLGEWLCPSSAALASSAAVVALTQIGSVGRPTGGAGGLFSALVVVEPRESPEPRMSCSERLARESRHRQPPLDPARARAGDLKDRGDLPLRTPDGGELRHLLVELVAVGEAWRA